MEQREHTLGEAEAPVAERSLAGQIRLWGGLVGAALLVIFLLQNLDDADVNFLFWDWKIPLIFALIGSAVLGALTTLLVGFFRGRAHRAELAAQLAMERQRERQKKR